MPVSTQLRVAALALTAMALSAQSSANASAQATAKIVRAITLTKNTDMDFADVVADTVGGTVVLTPTSGISSATLTILNQPSASAAKFTATGRPNNAVTVTLPGSATLNDGGANNLTVNAFTVSSGATSLNGSGSLAFTVGASLVVAPNQAEGTYSGSFSVTVAYN